MNSEIHQHSLRNLIFQRNAFLGLAVILGISLVIMTAFLFMKSERIIVVPPVLEKEFWVDSKGVSATYLEQYGYFLAELILSKSAQSASTQRAIVMRHTDPSYSTHLNKKLLEEEMQLEKERASYAFYPTGIYTNVADKAVTITGNRTTYVSGKAIANAQESYILKFTYQGSRLLLIGVTTNEVFK